MSNWGISFFNSGFPVWLHFIPGIKFRTDNEPFKVTLLLLFCGAVLGFEFTHQQLCIQAEMKRFTAKIVDMMKQEKLYASQGGPIILSQVFLLLI